MPSHKLIRKRPMKTISDILMLDLNDDIKNVIDLEDQKADEIQTEIESYILTEGLAKHLSDFINVYTSNIKESGVWISGFYGSGKSYFGKMLGHILANKNINGTLARDRFLPRIKGVKNESFLENDIRSLDAYQSSVVFLDSAKQNTDKGFSWTLFNRLLKTLGFRTDHFGYLEFELLLDGKLDKFQTKVKEVSGVEWSDVKKSMKETSKMVRRTLLTMDYSEKEYDDMMDTYKAAINDFSPSKLKDELSRYLSVHSNENMVFIFDETSEAITQEKYTLLDLEGISEALSSLGSRVWTLAIAQEKLDDVIKNASISKSNLIKVTDRFKTKLHVESTEVDLIIRSRLLQKKEEATSKLVEYYKSHEGQISDLTNLNSDFPTITTSPEDYAIYFPFHKYQFDLMQKFLFSSNALAASQIAARGMIITTFDVLRKQLRDATLFNSTTAFHLCTEAQTSPDSDLGIKYNTATRTLLNKDIAINGENLLKTIHFLTESVLATTIVENITKSYISNAEEYYASKPVIQKALDSLVDTKILLVKNQNYTITNNIESKLLEEMNNFGVEVFVKKREYIKYLQQTGIFKKVSGITLENQPYKFNIMSDQDDEIISGQNKHLNVVAYSIYNIGTEVTDLLDTIKMETQYEKSKMTIVPNTERSKDIDLLLTEIQKLGLIEEKYGNDNDDDKKKVARGFGKIKEEKEGQLLNLIKGAYINGTLVYLYDDYLLNELNFDAEINKQQEKLVNNLYTKRLNSQLSDETAKKVLVERDDTRLARLYSGDDFGLFDANGNFIGENLKVVEEIKQKIAVRYMEGKTIESDLSGIPWGYSYGTIASVLAALLRAGKLVVKSNATEHFSHKDKEVKEVFGNSRRFGSASYKWVSKSLSAADKKEMVNVLMQLECHRHINRKIDWNATDFELADTVKDLADRFLTILKDREEDLVGFDTLFPKAIEAKQILQPYTTKTTELNYIDRSSSFLAQKAKYIEAIKAIEDAHSFVKKNLVKYNGIKIYVEAVQNEVAKAHVVNEELNKSIAKFEEISKKDLVTNYKAILASAQKVRDQYFKLCEGARSNMTALYTDLAKKVNSAKSELNKYPKELNVSNWHQIDRLTQYANDRIIDHLQLEFNVVCRDCKYSLSDMLNYIALHASKQAELETMTHSFVVKAIVEPEPVGDTGTGVTSAPKKKEPKRMSINIPKEKMTVKQYKAILAQQLQGMAGMDNEDEVIIIKG